MGTQRMSPIRRLGSAGQTELPTADREPKPGIEKVRGASQDKMSLDIFPAGNFHGYRRNGRSPIK